MKKTIGCINSKKSLELERINNDKDKLIDDIKGLIETFSETHSKVFTETIEPIQETLTSLSTDILYILIIEFLIN